MSDEKSGNGGGGFGGPKKPKATFGDVMLGIPSGGGDRERSGGRGGGGRGGERGGGGDRGPRREGGGRPDAPRREDKPAGEKRASGPMVIIKRASGQVETRLPGEEPTAPVTEATPATEAGATGEAPAPAAPSPRARREKVEVAPATGPLYEDVPEDQSFAEMFEQSGGAPARQSVRVGQKVKGTIFQLGADTAFVSLGGAVKSEALIELRELKDDEGVLRYGVGDTIDAHIVEIGAKGIVLSRALAKGSANLALLAEARETGMPVEGLVLSVNKGGVEVAIGDIRAFCPISQLDVRFVEKPDTFIGEKLKFRVTEVRERNVVLSRRALLEVEQRAKAEEVRKTLEVGKVLRGRVTNVRDFGAFVDLGGIEGMVPVSEMSHVRIANPGEVVKVGDEVEVEVLRLEAAQPNSPDKSKQKERITLSMRARLEDPFKKALESIREGDRLQGKVVRLQPFGAFVELQPGVDGLVHVSALSDRRIAHPRDVVKEGDMLWVQVEKIDPSEKRIGLRRISDEDAAKPVEQLTAEKQARAAAEAAIPKPRPGMVVVGKVDRIESYGIFLAFPGGKGLVPGAETGTERGTDYKRVFSMGQEIKAEILDIDPTGKIRLSITGAQRAEERADMEAWKQSQPKGSGGKGFGTLADLLKAKLGK